MASMMYAINNIARSRLLEEEKRGASHCVLLLRVNQAPLGVSPRVQDGAKIRSEFQEPKSATRCLDGIRLGVKWQTQLRRGFLSTMIFR